MLVFDNVISAGGLDSDCQVVESRGAQRGCQRTKPTWAHTERFLTIVNLVNTHPQKIQELLRRISVLATLLLLCLPATNAHAAIGSLTNLILGDSGVCFEASEDNDEATEANVGMSIDPRTLQMSIDARALQNIQLAAQSIDTSSQTQSTAQPCEVDAQDEQAPAELCSKLPETNDEANEPLAAAEEDVFEAPAFVPASLTEDIVPLEPTNPRSCSPTSEGPDRCEPFPPLPQQLSLDIHSNGALQLAELIASHPPEKVYTLGLDPISPTRLLGPSDGFPRGPDQPPRA